MSIVVTFRPNIETNFIPKYYLGRWKSVES